MRARKKSPAPRSAHQPLRLPFSVLGSTTSWSVYPPNFPNPPQPVPEQMGLCLKQAIR
jgi:hypothetical protein